MAAAILTQARLKELLHYDPETGVFTRRIKNGTAKAGDLTGSKNLSGYLTIRLDNKSYYAHRLAWLYMTGVMPINKIDHANGIRSDNKFSNIREADNFQNAQNVPIKKNNSSGYKGVCFSRFAKKWVAQCTVNRKLHFLGYFETAESASVAYKDFAKKHHKEFFNAGR